MWLSVSYFKAVILSAVVAGLSCILVEKCSIAFAYVWCANDETHL
jgi:hypothetical protein